MSSFKSLLPSVPPWVVMWTLGVIVFGVVKLATALRVRGWTAARLLTYAVLTPTLDPRPSVSSRKETTPDRDLWTAGVGVATGIVIWGVLVPAVRLLNDWAAGMTVMAGVICGLHFGVLRLFTASCRWNGWNVQPLMQAPWRSTSPAEFWGQRWNTAFRDAAHRLVVQPLRGRLGTAPLTLVVFIVSGLIHDLVMSLPAGGFGRPTLYFIIQAIGLMLTKATWARRLRLDRGGRGTVWTALWLILPLPLLFHEPFCVSIMLPFYDACVGGVTQSLQPAERLIQVGGALQLSVLFASAATPLLLDWKSLLAPLPTLVRQMFWVYGGYIVLMIVSLATASFVWPEDLAGKTPLGTAVSGFTAVFWGIRLVVGWVAFDASPFLTNRWRQAAYALLTLVFTTLTIVYSCVTIAALLSR